MSKLNSTVEANSTTVLKVIKRDLMEKEIKSKLRELKRTKRFQKKQRKEKTRNKKRKANRKFKKSRKELSQKKKDVMSRINSGKKDTVRENYAYSVSNSVINIEIFFF